jgi:hypothetical protein
VEKDAGIGLRAAELAGNLLILKASLTPGRAPVSVSPVRNAKFEDHVA